jgi:hypothetical protein
MPDWSWQRPPEPPPPPRARWSLFGHWRRPVSTWTRNELDTAAVTVTVLVVLLVCGVGGLAAVLRGNLDSGTGGYTWLSADAVSATETAVVATAHAQSTAIAHGQPTATPRGPHVITGPSLGGTQDAFVAAFGQPTIQGGSPYYAFITSGGLSGGVCYCISDRGSDGQQRLDTLKVTASGWSYDKCAVVLRLFFPPDAQAVTTISDPQLGPIQVYQSPDLTLSFPAADFTFGGPGGGLVSPGTFSFVAQDPAQEVCGMNIGE